MSLKYDDRKALKIICGWLFSLVVHMDGLRMSASKTGHRQGLSYILLP